MANLMNFLAGMYIARQLSFHGVGFKIEEVPLDSDFVKVYDSSVRLWVEGMQRFHEAAELIDAESRMKKTMWGQFWSSHQRFFKYLCIAAKVSFTYFKKWTESGQITLTLIFSFFLLPV